jgi:hypothetical protein
MNNNFPYALLHLEAKDGLCHNFHGDKLPLRASRHRNEMAAMFYSLPKEFHSFRSLLLLVITITKIVFIIIILSSFFLPVKAFFGAFDIIKMFTVFFFGGESFLFQLVAIYEA